SAGVSGSVAPCEGEAEGSQDSLQQAEEPRVLVADRAEGLRGKEQPLSPVGRSLAELHPLRREEDPKPPPLPPDRYPYIRLVARQVGQVRGRDVATALDPGARVSGLELRLQVRGESLPQLRVPQVLEPVQALFLAASLVAQGRRLPMQKLLHALANEVDV